MQFTTTLLLLALCATYASAAPSFRSPFARPFARFFAAPESATNRWESRVYRQGITREVAMNFLQPTGLAGQSTWTGSVDFTLKIWDTGFCTHIQLVNPATIVSSTWTLHITLPTGANLVNSWSGDYTEDADGDGQTYTVTPAEWNDKIVPGSSKTTGFCADMDDGLTTANLETPEFALQMVGGSSDSVSTPSEIPVDTPVAVPTPSVPSTPVAAPATTPTAAPATQIDNGPSVGTPPTTTSTPRTTPSAVATPVTGPTPGNTATALAKLKAGKLLVGYWGQNTPFGTSGDELEIDDYCNGPYDVINVAFANVFRNTENTIDINLSSHCGEAFPGSTVLSCPQVGTAIKKCQALGKVVILSLGGGLASVGFTDAADIDRFTNALWNMFLGGTDATFDRPFGKDVVLDGFDLDVEGGSDYGYDIFMPKITSLMNASGRKFYATAAPQCFFPDVLQNTAYAKGYFDWLNIQWYNNACGNSAFPTSAWSDAVTFWYNWANTVSVNPNVGLLVGAPASISAASASSYVPLTAAGATTPSIANIVKAWKTSYSARFGGVMLWEVKTAALNGDYATGVRNILGA
ncbi:glycoside hydrolase superfamily [Fimicolochytrium jonesii]|uniref:glycoside hydrolase superfamily n=1 Tax=Fimicolochytrium jonesii TaxID=1396493 RepID=UPI0022FF0810|nr:glycoside hydrolase superfamily [Fimicolochytrium jonesii]KAI8826024.1 glycoside hydrolase superfamily [Fimicolochytrium jonesii]